VVRTKPPLRCCCSPYQEGFVYLRVGYASAMTVVFLAILVLMFLQYRLLDRRVHYT
jgi:multiple sugar transport system permease protein